MIFLISEPVLYCSFAVMFVVMLVVLEYHGPNGGRRR